MFFSLLAFFIFSLYALFYSFVVRQNLWWQKPKKIYHMSDAAIGDVPKEKAFMKISEISQKSTSGGVCYNKVADL